MSCAVSASAPSFFQKQGAPLYVDKQSCASFFTPGLPEENVYHLAKLLLEAKAVGSLAELTVVFITSHNKETHLWTLRNPHPLNHDSGLMVTDYHCILLQRTVFDEEEFELGEPGEPSPLKTRLNHPDALTYVWDLESDLGFPTRMAVYSQHALRSKHVAQMGPKCARMYRAVPAEAFVRLFCSERKHLPRRQDGNWFQPTPTLPCINPDRFRSVDNMHKYLNVVKPTDQDEPQTPEEQQWGVVLDEDELLRRFGVTPTKK